jgi:hypothetical protein
MPQKSFFDEIFNSKNLWCKRGKTTYLGIDNSLKANEARCNYLILKAVFSSLSAIRTWF